MRVRHKRYPTAVTGRPVIPLPESSGRTAVNIRWRSCLPDRTIFPDRRTEASTSRILSLDRKERYSFCHTVFYIQYHSNTCTSLCQASVLVKRDVDGAIFIAATAAGTDDCDSGREGRQTGNYGNNDSNFFHQAYFLSFRGVLKVWESGKRIYHSA